MFNWLVSMGLPSSGEYVYITYLGSVVLCLVVVILICSCLFGIFNAIFKTR